MSDVIQPRRIIVGISGASDRIPLKNVKFIVPFGPGSGADLVTRIVSERLPTRWGKPVTVENRRVQLSAIGLLP